MNTAIINLEAKKVELIAQITRIIDYDTLVKIERILHSFENETQQWKSLSKLDKQKLEVGLQDIKKGRVISNNAVKKNIDKFIKEL